MEKNHGKKKHVLAFFVWDVLTLDIQIPPEVWCFWYLWGVQTSSQEVFGCLGLVMSN